MTIEITTTGVKFTNTRDQTINVVSTKQCIPSIRSKGTSGKLSLLSTSSSATVSRSTSERYWAERGREIVPFVARGGFPTLESRSASLGFKKVYVCACAYVWQRIRYSTSITTENIKPQGSCHQRLEPQLSVSSSLLCHCQFRTSQKYCRAFFCCLHYFVVPEIEA